MKRRIIIFFIGIFLYFLFSSILQAAGTFNKIIPQPDVCFSPHGNCEKLIVKELNRAGAEIYIQAYSFTSASIAKALLDAKKRGVSIQIILDKSQRTQRYSSYTFFKNQNIPVYIDGEHAIAHNKIMIIDRSIVITGSYNFTKAAEEKNAENVLFIRSGELAKIYLVNWLQHKEHSNSD